MRKIITTTFISLDGVMQAPGGPEEDTSGGFKYGGWQLGSDWGKEADGIMEKFMAGPYELLFGRRTYDIFAAYWPNHDDEPFIGKPFNSSKKYVVSHKTFKPSWHNSSLITGDVVAEIKKLKKADGPDLWVWGSGNLIQTLLKNNLVDRMHIWTFPLTIGSGKKLFADGTQPEHFKPVYSKITSKGVIFATYEPSDPLKIQESKL
jgi:dihydrofolate reductase